MFILLPQIELVLQSSRVTGKSDVMGGISLFIPSVKTLFTAIIRGASNDALGNGYTSQYMGELFPRGIILEKQRLQVRYFIISYLY